MGREGLEGPPGIDGLPGIDGTKGVKVRTPSVVHLLKELEENKLSLLFKHPLCSGGARRRWRRGFNW